MKERRWPGARRQAGADGATPQPGPDLNRAPPAWLPASQRAEWSYIVEHAEPG